MKKVLYSVLLFSMVYTGVAQASHSHSPKKRSMESTKVTRGNVQIIEATENIA